jgi:ABC-type multidrug transport system ATPase subunit
MAVGELEIDSVWLEFNSRVILQDIYLKINRGTIVGLLGRNGSGKSSLIKIIFGTLRAKNQSVRVDKKFVSHPYLEKNLVRYLPQFPFVPSNLSLREACDFYEVSSSEVWGYFPDLEPFENTRLANLSGGHVRLIETLMIVLSPVSFVLLDEPFTHLAPVWNDKLMVVLRDQKQSKGILISDHYFENILEVSDSVYFLRSDGSTKLLTDANEQLILYGYKS